MSESAFGSEDGYQSLLALKSANYLNQTVADFDKALLDWVNQHPEEHLQQKARKLTRPHGQV